MHTMAHINLFGNISSFMRSLRLINTKVHCVATVNGLVGCTEAGKTQTCFFPAATRVPFTEVG